MKLNHINLPVADVGAARDFFVTYFGMKVAFELGKGVLAMIRDEGEMILILSHFDKDRSAEVAYHRDFHVGFIVETRAEVDAQYALLSGAGLAHEAPRQMAGRYGFYLPAPGGFEVEVAILGRAAGPAATDGADGEVAGDRR